jgi:XTP/dITP diphosphohydrolase
VSRIVVASMNKGKLAEIRDRIEVLGYEISSLADMNNPIQIEEDRDTFEGNAEKKATAVLSATGFASLADDSGLEIDAIDGRPGVLSARYGGAGLSDKDRYELLLKELKNIPLEKRTARFKAALAFAEPNKGPRIFKGAVEGRIAFEPAGSHGFGYDPIFIPLGYEKTLAELGPEVKNRISHRAKALDAFVEWLKDVRFHR